MPLSLDSRSIRQLHQDHHRPRHCSMPKTPTDPAHLVVHLGLRIVRCHVYNEHNLDGDKDRQRRDENGQKLWSLLQILCCVCCGETSTSDNGRKERRWPAAGGRRGGGYLVLELLKVDDMAIDVQCVDLAGAEAQRARVRERAAGEKVK